jgi:serine/threonine-protein kinase
MTSLQLVTTLDEMVDGKYQLLDVIGSGGVGTVYHARHVWTEREVAVKVLHRDLPHLSELRTAFLREARAAVQLRHPNVVDVLDMGEDASGTTYMVMELLSGPTLRDVLAARGSLEPEETMVVLGPLIDALDKAHQLGIVHKDFKPENIILDTGADGSVVPTLLDFGVAQILRDSGAHGASEPETVLIGTPQYMSPEQARAESDRVGPHSDVWGVGIVWYECLTGRCPFDGDTHAEALEAVIRGQLDLSELPDPHARLISGMLQREIEDRTPSLSMLRDQMVRDGLLTRFTREESSTFRITTPSARAERILETLHGVGPLEQKRVTEPPREEVGVPVEPAVERTVEPRPHGSTRKPGSLGLLGLTVAAAVGLAAWWVIGTDSGARDAPPSTPEAVAEVAPERVPEPAQPIARDATASSAKPTLVDAETPGVTSVDEQTSGETVPEPSVTEEATKPSTTTEEPPAAAPSTRTEPPPASEQAPAPRKEPVKPRRVDAPPDANDTYDTYERPPDLVTEW